MIANTSQGFRRKQHVDSKVEVSVRVVNMSSLGMLQVTSDGEEWESGWKIVLTKYLHIH